MQLKIGRNEPCPCGSGKKFKHCCGSPRAVPVEESASHSREVIATARVGDVLNVYGSTMLKTASIEKL